MCQPLWNAGQKSIKLARLSQYLDFCGDFNIQIAEGYCNWQHQLDTSVGLSEMVWSAVFHLNIYICPGRYLYFRLYLRSDTTLQYMHYGSYLTQVCVWQRSTPWRPCLPLQIKWRIDKSRFWLWRNIWSRNWQYGAVQKWSLRMFYPRSRLIVCRLSLQFN